MACCDRITDAQRRAYEYLIRRAEARRRPLWQRVLERLGVDVVIL